MGIVRGRPAPAHDRIREGKIAPLEREVADPPPVVVRGAQRLQVLDRARAQVVLDQPRRVVPADQRPHATVVIRRIGGRAIRGRRRGSGTRRARGRLGRGRRTRGTLRDGDPDRNETRRRVGREDPQHHVRNRPPALRGRADDVRGDDPVRARLVAVGGREREVAQRAVGRDGVERVALRHRDIERRALRHPHNLAHGRRDRFGEGRELGVLVLVLEQVEEVELGIDRPRIGQSHCVVERVRVDVIADQREHRRLVDAAVVAEGHRLLRGARLDEWMGIGKPEVPGGAGAHVPDDGRRADRCQLLHGQTVLQLVCIAGRRAAPAIEQAADGDPERRVRRIGESPAVAIGLALASQSPDRARLQMVPQQGVGVVVPDERPEKAVVRLGLVARLERALGRAARPRHEHRGAHARDAD